MTLSRRTRLPVEADVDVAAAEVVAVPLVALVPPLVADVKLPSVVAEADVALLVAEDVAVAELDVLVPPIPVETPTIPGITTCLTDLVVAELPPVADLANLLFRTWTLACRTLISKSCSLNSDAWSKLQFIMTDLEEVLEQLMSFLNANPMP
jgi:hypothetical protein